MVDVTAIYLVVLEITIRKLACTLVETTWGVMIIRQRYGFCEVVQELRLFLRPHETEVNSLARSDVWQMA